MAEYVRVYKQVDGIWTWVTELESGAGGDVTAADIDSTPATNGQVLTADGAGGADWEDSGGSLPSGDGSPVGVVTPTGIGGLYLDMTNGALYIAVGLTDADWIGVGGAVAGTVQGVSASAGYAALVPKGPGNAALTDVDGSQGTGNGVSWNVGSEDGTQTFTVKTGATGEHLLEYDAAGALTNDGVPVGGSLPAQWTVDPDTGALEIQLTGDAGDSDFADALVIRNAGGERILSLDSSGEMQVNARDPDATPFNATGAGIVAQMFSENEGGAFGILAPTEPPDAAIGNGVVAWWFDATNGAPKLMFKAKQLDGTVVTGELALT